MSDCNDKELWLLDSNKKPEKQESLKRKKSLKNKNLEKQKYPEKQKS